MSDLVKCLLADAEARRERTFTDSGDRYLQFLQQIADEDAAGLLKAQQSYGNSWKSRGGVGAFMMLARKWDRLENRLRRGADHLVRALIGTVQRELFDKQITEPANSLHLVEWLESKLQELSITAEHPDPSPYDIFAHVFADPRAEGVIDDIRDLRRYLMLVEAELRARGFDATHRDNKPGA